MAMNNLLVELRRVGLHQRAAAQKIGIAESLFSASVNGYREFKSTERAALVRLTGVPEHELFSTERGGRLSPSLSASSVREQFKLLDECLASGGDLCFILEKALRRESPEVYEMCCQYVTGLLHARLGIKPNQNVHFAFHWEGNNAVFDPGPPRRAECTLQMAGSSLVHPVHRDTSWPLTHENTMLNPGGERR